MKATVLTLLAALACGCGSAEPAPELDELLRGRIDPLARQILRDMGREEAEGATRAAHEETGDPMLAMMIDEFEQSSPDFDPVARWIQGLDSTDYHVRGTAFYELRQIVGPEHVDLVPRLVEALDDTINSSVPISAGVALSRIGPAAKEQALDPVLRRLVTTRQSNEIATFQTAAFALTTDPQETLGMFRVLHGGGELSPAMRAFVISLQKGRYARFSPPAPTAPPRPRVMPVAEARQRMGPAMSGRRPRDAQEVIECAKALESHGLGREAAQILDRGYRDARGLLRGDRLAGSRVLAEQGMLRQADIDALVWMMVLGQADHGGVRETLATVGEEAVPAVAEALGKIDEIDAEDIEETRRALAAAPAEESAELAAFIEASIRIDRDRRTYALVHTLEQMGEMAADARPALEATLDEAENPWIRLAVHRALEAIGEADTTRPERSVRPERVEVDPEAVESTLADLRTLSVAMNVHAVDEKSLPEPHDRWVPVRKLESRLGEYLEEFPVADAWGHDFIYWSDGRSFRLVSSGVNGKVEQEWSVDRSQFYFADAGDDIVVVNSEIVVQPRRR